MTAPRRWLALVAALCLGALAASPALAHASLVSSNPADGSTVTGSAVTEVALTFDAELDAARSRFDLVVGSDTVATGHVGSDPKTMTATGLGLLAGDYEARWTAVASDGDLTRGVVTFHVVAGAPASSGARPSDRPSAGAPAIPDAGPQDVLVPIVAAGAIVLVVGVVLLRRTRVA